MKLILPGLFIVILGTVSGKEALEAVPRKFINKDIVKKINGMKTTWTAHEPENNPLSSLTDDEIQGMLGLRDPMHGTMFSNYFSRSNTKSSLLKSVFGFEAEKSNIQSKRLNDALPSQFDARTEWPACIHPVRNQGGCGSCWAFSSAGFLEDRFCIASGGAINVQLSPQDMVTCDYGNGGCTGGYLTPALNYLIAEGVVSETCMAYNGATNYCLYQCDDATTPYKKYGCKPGSIKLMTTHDEIKQELKTNGPMQVGFTVYNDFLNYSGGVYKYLNDGWVAGSHAVKIIGWDYDGNNNLFWLCQNQWGTNWGEQGFFKIYAGEAGIDSVAYACDPDLS